MTIVYGLDPGTTESALVGWDGRVVTWHQTDANDVVSGWLQQVPPKNGRILVVEQIESFGMAVGRETFETVWWAGRFHETFEYAGGTATRLTRRAVKLHLCQSAKAKDANIRQAIIDRFGGKDAAIGKKATQGPLYGIKGHEFAALAVALTYWDQNLRS